MDKDKQIQYWLKSAGLDWETANDIFSSGKNFHFCLFICHLVIEKILKAIVVDKTNSHPSKTHNLLRLVEISGLEITDIDVKFLE